jgi:hypothetical protein
MHIDFLRQAGAELPIAPSAPRVTSLRVWHCRFRSLASLAAYEGLEELVVASFPDDSLESIGALPRLRYLKVVHLPKVASLLQLAALSRLESLSLATLPTWDSAKRCTTVSSLEPLASLRSLRHVELFGVCPPDRSLAALYECHWLETARFSRYPSDTVETFYRLTGAFNDFNPPATFERSGS